MQQSRPYGSVRGGRGVRIPTATVAEERGDHSPYADLLTLRFSIPRFLGNKFAP